MKDLVDDLRRFLHWGPIVIFSLTFFVTGTTLTMNSMLWPLSTSLGSLINYSLIWFNMLGLIYNFMRSMMVGPGYLPRKWCPDNPKDVEFLQFCHKCDGYKAPRSHHCRRCNRCVLKMDHHCPWISNCVGWDNQASFIYFLLFFLAASIQSSWIVGLAFIRGISKSWLIKNEYYELATVTLNHHTAFASLMSFAISVGVGLACVKLLHMQGKVLFSNRTDIETWIVKKARYRRDKDVHQCIEPFEYPYDLGWKANIQEVFFPNNDGITFPVRPGCHQYTLTIEQLAQKKDKWANAQLFRCIRKATGHWVPIFSQGLLIALDFPCNDDPRIALQPGDRIRVTRFQTFWVYGEREITEEEKEKGSRRAGAIRGWFPRCCGVRISNAIDDCLQAPVDQSPKDDAQINKNLEEKESCQVQKKRKASHKEPSRKKKIIEDATKLGGTNNVGKSGNDTKASGEPAPKNLEPLDSPPVPGIL